MTTEARDADLSPSAIAAVEEALRAFARALRAVQLYLPNNPARAQSVAQARQAFARVWAWVSPRELGVRELAFVLDDRVVYHDAERSTESLPWLLHRDGIRALTFAPGFEEESLAALLSMIQATRVASSDDDDLVTRLSVADLADVTYRFVDTAGSLDLVLASGDRPGIAQAVGEAPLAVPTAETPPPGEGPAPIVRIDDFDSTLYFLDAREVQYLRGALAREHTEDRRTLVVASLLDIVEQPGETAASREALDLLNRLIPEWLALGEYELVAYSCGDIPARRTGAGAGGSPAGAPGAAERRGGHDAAPAIARQACPYAGRVVARGSVHRTASKCARAVRGVAGHRRRLTGPRRRRTGLASTRRCAYGRPGAAP